MKVILGGATGNAGRQALKYCLQEDRITWVVVLSRKSLPNEVTNNPKVEVVLHDDFTQYPASILDKLKGAEACVWYEKLLPFELVYAPYETLTRYFIGQSEEELTSSTMTRKLATK